MSTLKVNKIRDTSGSADAIVLDPNGGAKIAGVCTATTFSGAFSGDAASLTQIPAANLVGVCTSGLTKTGGFGKFASYAIIADVKSTGTNGGTFTCVFGSESSSNDSNNRVLIRFKLTDGNSISDISLSDT